MQFKNYEINTIENLSLIAAILNSQLAQYYIRKHIAPKIGSTFIETKIFHLEKIPVPERIFNNCESLLNKTRNIIVLQKRFLRDDENVDNVKRQINEVQNDINELIYKHYDLTDQLIKTIEEN